MAQLSEASCGSFSTATTHGTIDVDAKKNGIFITCTLFFDDPRKPGKKGFIAAYMQGGWDDFIENFLRINQEVIMTPVAKQENGKPAASSSTTMIRMGEMKGRTISAALEEFGEEKLRQHMQYLESLEKQNPGKYPANLTIINEIKKVLNGGGEETGTPTLKTYKLWESDNFKASPTKKAEDGYSLCTRLQITATPGTPTPYLITIEQGYAPLKPVGDNGLMAIELGKMRDKRMASIFVNRQDFTCTVKEANRRYKVYREEAAKALCRKQMTAKY